MEYYIDRYTNKIIYRYIGESYKEYSCECPQITKSIEIRR